MQPPPHRQPQPAVYTEHHYQQTKYWSATGQNLVAQGHAEQPHHYTPENALRGIAADDYSLQETWQSYMYKVKMLS